MLNLNQFANSHDSLKIVQRDKKSYVLKTFHTDLERANRNIEKQRLFRPLHTGSAQVISAPVLEFNFLEDRAELLMPYIEGMTGHTIPVHATRNIAQTLSASLSTLIYSELSESREEQVATLQLRKKLVSVAAATHDPALKRLVEYCFDVIDSLPDEMSYPIGRCHGDLTLSNVILDPVSGVILIDFLETFLETPLQDVAKLKQDFLYGWSFRNCPPQLSVKAEILCRKYFPQAIVQLERMYPEQVHVLTLLTLARIAPYVKDEVTQQWLIYSLTDCLGVEPK
jgi:tRNA A-37 threonylcarbamoyl transferase component Bud32